MFQLCVERNPSPPDGFHSRAPNPLRINDPFSGSTAAFEEVDPRLKGEQKIGGAMKAAALPIIKPTLFNIRVVSKNN